MDLELSEGHRKLQERVAGLCDAQLSPATVRALDQTNKFPDGLYAAMAQAGLLRVTLPPALGGEGGDLFDAVLVAEQLGKHSGTASSIYLVNAVFGGGLLLLVGSDDQKQELLPLLGSGNCKLAFALSEPDAGSDVAAISTSGARDGSDFVINGTKLYTTGANVADYILTVVRTRPGERASHGSTVFLVPGDAQGLDISPMNKIAGNAFASCEVHYRDVRVPESNVLGGPGAVDHGWGQLMLAGNIERLGVAAASLGMAQAAYQEAETHARHREQFGRPIVGFQAIQHALVEMLTDIEAMRWLTYHAAWSAARGKDGAVMIGMAKLFAAEKLNVLVLRAMKILGGKAYLVDCPLQRIQREALLSYYAGGTSEIQKNIIGRLLGLVPPR